IGLTNQPVGGRVIGLRNFTPDQQPVMPGVADEEWSLRSAEAGAARTEQRVGRRPDRLCDVDVAENDPGAARIEKRARADHRGALAESVSPGERDPHHGTTLISTRPPTIRTALACSRKSVTVRHAPLARS